MTPTAAGGTVMSWSITPALPAGLVFSTTNGNISGTPTASSPSTVYVVTAQNSGGQTTVNLTIEVDGGPLLEMGHQAAISSLRETARNILSLDGLGHWIVWSYASATVLASGQGCTAGAESSNCQTLATSPFSSIDSPNSSDFTSLAGTTAAIATGTGFSLYSTTDGHQLGSITTSVTWWQLASDGSYLTAGSSKGVSAWSTSGQLLFTRAGNYATAIAFAAPGEIQIGAGPARQNSLETLALPTGTSTIAPTTFSGQITSWFPDGSKFITIAGDTALIYSNTVVQLGSIQDSNVAVAPSSRYVVGQGTWVWTFGAPGTPLYVYPIGNKASPTSSFSLSTDASPTPSGSTIGVLTEESAQVNIIDLSASTPTETTFTIPFEMDTYSAVSASQWVVGDSHGVLLDGATIAGTLRYFGYGEVMSIAGGTRYFAVATASGRIPYFDSHTLALLGDIVFSSSQIVMSADGTELVAQGDVESANVTNTPVGVYALPAGDLVYNWPYTYNSSTGGTFVDALPLSSSGNLLGQTSDVYSTGGGTGLTETKEAQASAPTGGTPVYSASGAAAGFLTISPDGTLIASESIGLPLVDSYLESIPSAAGSSIIQNGSLVTAVSGVSVGWLDNSRLLVNSYQNVQGSGLGTPYIEYAGCALYSPTGGSAGTCALPSEVPAFQVLTSDTIYVPSVNQILSVSTGARSWASADPLTAHGAVAGSWPSSSPAPACLLSHIEVRDHVVGRGIVRTPQCTGGGMVDSSNGSLGTGLDRHSMPSEIPVKQRPLR